MELERTVKLPVIIPPVNLMTARISAVKLAMITACLGEWDTKINIRIYLNDFIDFNENTKENTTYY